MKGRILVTGGHGFVGRGLIPALTQAFPDAELYTTSRSQTSAVGRAHNIKCDLTDRASVLRVVTEVQPSCIINLAAISHIPTAMAAPELTWQTNLHGTLNLLDALVAKKMACTFLQIGSGDCYGHAFVSGQALAEATPFEPLNPYAASKAAADIAAYSYTRHQHIKVIRARPFNHTAAGQSSEFVVSAFAEQIARIEVGLQPAVVKVGNLEAQRCFLHLDDVVAAYIELLRRRDDITSGEAFNIVSASAVPMSQVLEGLIALSAKDIAIEIDPERVRPVDIPVALGAADKLIKLTAWQPTRDLHYILSDVLSYWRDSVSATPEA